MMSETSRFSSSIKGRFKSKRSGAWYDEVAGEGAAGELTLRALANLTAPERQSANVTVVTHLTLARVKTLMAGGAALGEAADKAESELRSQLEVGGKTSFPKGAAAS
jgi:hypothetical protein